MPASLMRSSARVAPRSVMRVTAISATTSATVAAEGVELPSIYFAHPRRVFQRDGMWLAENPWTPLIEGEEIEDRLVRFRTVGDATGTGAVRSEATHYEAVIEETAATRITERGATRADDRISEAGMEDRKREGYF